MQTMTLGTSLIQGLTDGRLGAAVWHGRHDLEPGRIRLRAPAGDVTVEMTITEVGQKAFADLSDREARESGEPDREALWAVMHAAYPDMTRSDDVTIAFME
jgi:hypothetical protein